MNNLPVEIKETLFSRIKKFFKNLFKKKNQIEEEKEIDHVLPKKQNNTISELKQEYKKTENENYILDQIDKEPKLLYNLPKERLEQLLQLYNKRLEEIENKNIELDKKIQILQNQS